MYKYYFFVLTPLFFLFSNESCNERKTIELPKKEIAVEMKPKTSKSFLMGKFVPEKHPSFIVIDQKYADRSGMYLQKEVYHAFKDMYTVAKKAGINLIIRSATRNFDYQKDIWERKWTGATALSNGVNLGSSDLSDKEKAEMILLYSSMPGTSRHHWGTDFDINAFNNSYFESGEGLKVYEWMLENASTFGFCQPYTPKGNDRPYGYEEEKWHWSYLPLSSVYTVDVKEQITDEDITGFKGSNTAKEIKVVEKYILGINEACMLR